MMTVLRNIIAVVALVAIYFFATNYLGLFKEQAGVKGANTDRAHEISQEIGSDIGKQVGVAKDQALQIKVQDVVDFFTRFQKIPEDVTNAKGYVQGQFENVLQAREEAREENKK